jgi:hypothetical protein
MNNGSMEVYLLLVEAELGGGEDCPHVVAVGRDVDVVERDQEVGG